MRLGQCAPRNRRAVLPSAAASAAGRPRPSSRPAISRTATSTSTRAAARDGAGRRSRPRALSSVFLLSRGARGGARTRTALAGQRILSPLRLPVSPPGPARRETHLPFSAIPCSSGRASLRPRADSRCGRPPTRFPLALARGLQPCSRHSNSRMRFAFCQTPTKCGGNSRQRSTPRGEPPAKAGGKPGKGMARREAGIDAPRSHSGFPLALARGPQPCVARARARGRGRSPRHQSRE